MAFRMVLRSAVAGNSMRSVSRGAAPARRLCSKPSKATPSTNSADNTFRRGPITWASFALTGVALYGLLLYFEYEKARKNEGGSKKVKSFGTPALGGSWTLVDHEGIPKTDQDYLGGFHILYFGFTYCPDICPNELVKIGDVTDALAKKGLKLKPIFISVDPNRDTVEQMASYRKDFHPDMDYLTGTRDQISEAARAFRVYFSKADEHEEDVDDYLVDHSIVLYLIGPDGKFLDFFTQSREVPDIVKNVLDHAKEYA